jgi:hypothetical protein
VDEDIRRKVTEELRQAFGEAEDVTPAPGQPFHVILPRLELLPPWRPSPTRALLCFANWPSERPQFWIDPAVANAEGHPPRSNSEQLILGDSWRYFSFSFPWPVSPLNPVRAAQAWLNRFREPS